MNRNAEDVCAIDFALSHEGRYVEKGYAVYPNSLLFRAGDYPDKKFHAAPEDLTQMAADWKPVKGNIEHKKFLRGRAGVIPSVWTEEAGAVLRGVVQIPLALDGLLTEQEKKVSLEINRKTKQASGFALTTDPRVDDAVLMSLDTADFERHDTPHGQRGMQELHDVSVRFGAVCSEKNANMASSHENEAVQAIHDLACAHGAQCDKVSQPTRTRYGYSYWSRENSKSQNAAHRSGKRNRKMPKTLTQRLKDFFLARDLDEEEAADFANELSREIGEKEPAGTHENADFSKLSQEIADLRKEVAKKDAASVVAEFGDRIYPHEKDGLIALFAQAAADDARNEATLTFSIGEEEKSGSRVATLTTLLENRPRHEMLGEQMPVGVLLNTQETQERKPSAADFSASDIYAERRKQMHG